MSTGILALALLALVVAVFILSALVAQLRSQVALLEEDAHTHPSSDDEPRMTGYLTASPALAGQLRDVTAALTLCGVHVNAPPAVRDSVDTAGEETSSPAPAPAALAVPGLVEEDDAPTGEVLPGLPLTGYRRKAPVDHLSVEETAPPLPPVEGRERISGATREELMTGVLIALDLLEESATHPRREVRQALLGPILHPERYAL